MKLSIQDLAAALVSIILAIGLAVLAQEEKDIPAEMSIAFTAALTWLFRGQVEAAKNGRDQTP